ncbi:MAG: substrate-binding domain-containing protein [Candidatus Humimicrobiaceae bacterium]
MSEAKGMVIKMKKSLLWITILVLSISMLAVFSLAGCKTTEVAATTAAAETTAAATTAAAEKPAELVVAGVVFQEDQFMKLLEKGYIDAAKDAGVKCLTGNTANDQSKEVELINTYLAQKVNGLAIAPLDPKTSGPMLKKANDAGMKIAVTNVELSDAPYIVADYTSSNKNIGQTTGKAAAKFIQEKLGGKANIAILQFKSLLPVQSGDRVNGFLEELKSLPGVKVVADQDAWLQDKAIAVAGDILTANKDIDIIYAANEGGTIGATMAVKNAGLAGKVFTFGTDASEQLVSMLKDPDNILQAITGQDPYNQGYKAMDTLIKALKGEDVSATQGKITIVPGIALRRDDPDGIKKFETDLAAKTGK